MEDPGGLQSMGSLESDMTERLHFHFSLSCTGEEMATHSSVLAWKIPGAVEPGGLLSMGSHRVGHDYRDLAASHSQLHQSKNIRNEFNERNVRLVHFINLCWLKLKSKWMEWIWMDFKYIHRFKNSLPSK